MTPAVNRRRMYADCRYGQLHLRSAFPPSGGFDELTTLLCLHGEHETSRVFDELLAQLGTDRSVYAPDLPGHGESDPLLRPAEATECAAALGDFLEQMRLRRVDLLGHRWGGLVAAELALARPDWIRRITLVSAPVTAAMQEVPGRLAGLTQPVMVLRTRDEYWDVTSSVRTVLPAARMIELPGLGESTLASSSNELTKHLRGFLL